MKIINKASDIELLSFELRSGGTIGFVPTMGALHEGHASLVRRAKLENEQVIVSIFVNPTQFNNSQDFEKYPIRTQDDIALLESLDCDYLFLPSVEEIYPSNLSLPNVDLGDLDQVMEGKYRPGHFKGVVQVVYRLFDLVKPTRAYFGLKDFQQVSVIKKMVDELHLGVQIVPCETLREADGLAMSSRNLRLSEEQRLQALFIYKSLNFCKENSHRFSPNEMKEQVEQMYRNSDLELEYIEFIKPDKLTSLSETWVSKAVACVVAYVGEVRLIDNMCVYQCD